MLKNANNYLDYKIVFGEKYTQILDQLSRNKRTIFLLTIQWTAITAACFFLVNGTGTLAINSLTPQISNPAHSDLNASYDEWTSIFHAPINPKIIDEITKDHPSSIELFDNPGETDPYEFPLITQVPQETDHYSSVDAYLQLTFISEPTNAQSHDQSSNSLPILTSTPPPSDPTEPSLPKGHPLVTLCHKPDGPNKRTFYVSQGVVDNHLAHGDYVGPCSN